VLPVEHVQIYSFGMQSAAKNGGLRLRPSF
jgi:hypothetical protein